MKHCLSFIFMFLPLACFGADPKLPGAEKTIKKPGRKNRNKFDEALNQKLKGLTAEESQEYLESLLTRMTQGISSGGHENKQVSPPAQEEAPYQPTLEEILAWKGSWSASQREDVEYPTTSCHAECKFPNHHDESGPDGGCSGGFIPGSVH